MYLSINYSTGESCSFLMAQNAIKVEISVEQCYMKIHKIRVFPSFFSFENQGLYEFKLDLRNIDPQVKTVFEYLSSFTTYCANTKKSRFT